MEGRKPTIDILGRKSMEGRLLTIDLFASEFSTMKAVSFLGYILILQGMDETGEMHFTVGGTWTRVQGTHTCFHQRALWKDGRHPKDQEGEGGLCDHYSRVA